MGSKYNFANLFILEMANNHQGDVEHGLRIINEMAAVAHAADVRAAVKLQFRELDSFIHPDFRKDTNNKHIQRFLSTRLSKAEFARLVEATRAQGLVTMCTPFDEPSVEQIVDCNIEIIKIGSPSATDWPLLEVVARTGKPVICSTGGLNIKEIDNIASFFQHRGVEFAIMHCVGIYPTPNKDLQLNQIETLKNRYPDVMIGFSSHEDPNDFNPIRVAFAKGARIFERHVGVPTEKYQLNAYSSTPAQIGQWFAAYRESYDMCGSENRPPVSHVEEASLHTLRRGVFAKHPIKKGEPIHREDVFFSMPIQSGQLWSGKWKNDLVADVDYAQHQGLNELLVNRQPSKKEIIYTVIHEVKGMLNAARIPIGSEFSIEMSHHYGVERFYEVGAIIIEVINRSYCKKLVIQLPNQSHPYHYHKKKEETFQVLWGELEIEIAGRKKVLHPGDIQLVQPGVWHKFQTHQGVIFEEISTTAFNNDSFYEDQNISLMAREDRKTKLANWGRHQFD